MISKEQKAEIVKRVWTYTRGYRISRGTGSNSYIPYP